MTFFGNLDEPIRACMIHPIGFFSIKLLKINLIMAFKNYVDLILKRDNMGKLYPVQSLRMHDKIY